MATSVIAGVQQITVTVDNPGRDDLGGLLIWMSTTSGFVPGAGNLVYNGPDLKVVLPGLTAGTAQFLKLALYSQIDSTDYDMSLEFTATPVAPSAKADDITAGTIRGSNVFAGSFGTKGTTLDGAVLAAAATINVKSTADFPAAGTAMVFGATNDRDLFTYTAKTATSFTGCSGVLAQSDGTVVIPIDRQLMIIDHNINEMRFFGNRGDGVFEELAGIGRRSSGADFVVGTFGSADFTAGGAVYANNSSIRATIDASNNGTGYSVDGVSNLGTGVHGSSSGTGKHGVYGQSFHATGGAGVRGEASGTGAGVSGRSVNGAGLEATVASTTLVRSQLYLQPGVSLPSGTSLDGDVSMLTGGRTYVYDGAAWREVFKNNDTILGNAGAAATPGHSFSGDPDTGIFLRSSNTLGFATAGVEAGFIGPAGVWNFTVPVRLDGIEFPATQVASANANTLDDYEEGTFTPRIDGTTTAGVGTYSVQIGTYTKIGNRVVGDIVLTWSAHTGTGNIEVAGLPFARKNNGASSPVTGWNNGVALTAANTLQPLIPTGASTIAIYQVNASGTAAFVPMDTAGTFRLAFQYDAA